MQASEQVRVTMHLIVRIRRRRHLTVVREYHQQSAAPASSVERLHKAVEQGLGERAEIRLSLLRVRSPAMGERVDLWIIRVDQARPIEPRLGQRPEAAPQAGGGAVTVGGGREGGG